MNWSIVTINLLLLLSILFFFFVFSHHMLIFSHLEPLIKNHRLLTLIFNYDQIFSHSSLLNHFKITNNRVKICVCTSNCSTRCRFQKLSQLLHKSQSNWSGWHENVIGLWNLSSFHAHQLADNLHCIQCSAYVCIWLEFQKLSILI